METYADPEDFPAYIPIDPRSPDPDFRPGAVWTQARADYLAGESAPRVCQRYELALSTFRTRMRVEGWRRCDQKDEEVEPRELDPAPPTPELVDQAWRAMADALKRGRAYEARTFLRLVHDLRAEVSREEALVQHQAWKAAQAGTLDPDLHGLHSGSNSAADAQLAGPSSSPTLSGLVPGIHLPGGQLAETAGDGPQGRALGRRDLEDTVTSDPALHCPQSGSHSAATGGAAPPEIRERFTEPGCGSGAAEVWAPG
ncbi:MAG: hypothetical protein M3N05_08355 [Pseudomonadota bacterium]|nr:hypothetical protein [Pseudomonadota bacterium]